MTPSGPHEPGIDESGTGEPPQGTRSARRRHLWLLVLPFLWQVAAVPWANGVTRTFWSLPFLLVWQMAGILFATAIIAIVYWIDHRPGGGRA